MGRAALGWVSGCAVIWSSLFATGNFLYGRTTLALTLTAIFAVSGAVLLYVVNTLWDRQRGVARLGQGFPDPGRAVSVLEERRLAAHGAITTSRAPIQCGHKTPLSTEGALPTACRPP